MDQDPNPKIFLKQTESQTSEFVLIDSRLREKVEGLAHENQRDSKDFHQTRPPFTRLRDILGPIQTERAPLHPSRCHSPGCVSELGGHFYKKADGTVLCVDCFTKMNRSEVENE